MPEVGGLLGSYERVARFVLACVLLTPCEIWLFLVRGCWAHPLATSLRYVAHPHPGFAFVASLLGSPHASRSVLGP